MTCMAILGSEEDVFGAVSGVQGPWEADRPYQAGVWGFMGFRTVHSPACFSNSR